MRLLHLLRLLVQLVCHHRWRRNLLLLQVHGQHVHLHVLRWIYHSSTGQKQISEAHSLFAHETDLKVHLCGIDVEHGTLHPAAHALLHIVRQSPKRKMRFQGMFASLQLLERAPHFPAKAFLLGIELFCFNMGSRKVVLQHLYPLEVLINLTQVAAFAQLIHLLVVSLQVLQELVSLLLEFTLQGFAFTLQVGAMKNPLLDGTDPVS
mmetsp:Transcript_56617/g.115387  ORF Transcript_56617/g.115387 Transcript_56617/m.115387 type:complete len:207 (-) Transcript_56617:1799-2419(-)